MNYLWRMQGFDRNLAVGLAVAVALIVVVLVVVVGVIGIDR